MNYILFDGPNREALLPFTYTRPVADIRIGILTIREKWELFLGATTTTITEDYLSDKYPMVEMEENIIINASYLPSDALVNQIKNLSKNQAVYDGDAIVAFFRTHVFQQKSTRPCHCQSIFQIFSFLFCFQFRSTGR